MTLIRAKHEINMARCAKCDHDLEISPRKNAKITRVFCSNPKCHFNRKPHPTGSMLNEGKR